MVDFAKNNKHKDDEGYNDPDNSESELPSIAPVINKTYKGRAEVKEIEGTIIRETDSAILFRFQQEGCNIRLEWFPLSQVKSIHNMKASGNKDKIVISNWIANKKDMV